MPHRFFPCLALLLFAACSPASNGGNETQDSDITVTEVPATDNAGQARIEEEHQFYMSAYADSVNKGLVETDTFKGSARRETKANIGGTTVRVNYGSPGVRGRVIWNGLVSYDQVWVTGSHWATAVEFSKDITVNGTNVPAGTYAFFTIPGREEWVLILNRVYDQHLADSYTTDEDVVRISVKPETLPDVVQRLTYEVAGTGEKQGAISMFWEKIRVTMPFTVQ